MLSFSNPNATAESRSSRPGCSTQCAAWALPLVHSPRLAPKPLDAWFFEAAGVGMHLPSPGWLAASRRLRRRRKRGGLSFGCAGWARSAARGCRAAVRRRVTRLGDRAAGHASGHKIGLHGQWHGRTCMPVPWRKDKTWSAGHVRYTDRNVTIVRV